MAAAVPFKKTSSRYNDINCDKQTSTSTLALGYPPLSQDTTAYRSAARAHSVTEQFRHLFHRFVIGFDHPLVGLDAEGSDVIQKTLHQLFILTPKKSCAPSSSPNVTRAVESDLE